MMEVNGEQVVDRELAIPIRDQLKDSHEALYTA
jgi:hypothetical protein